MHMATQISSLAWLNRSMLFRTRVTHWQASYTLSRCADLDELRSYRALSQLPHPDSIWPS